MVAVQANCLAYMAQLNQRPPKEKGNRNANDPNFNWRGIVLCVIAIILIGGALVFRGGPYGGVEEIQGYQFDQLLADKKIVNDVHHPVEIVREDGRPTQWVKGYFHPQQGEPIPFRVQVDMEYDRYLQSRLKAGGLDYVTVKSESNLLASAVIGFLPIALFLLVLYFFFRQQIRMAGKGALNFGKSKARMLARDKNKITFKDVAGVEEAKDEVQELVEFLKDPKKFQKLGGRIP